MSAGGTIAAVGERPSKQKSSQYYNEYSFKEPRRKLNFEKLIMSRALRITHPGDGKGGVVKDDDPSKFSVVTHINDTAPDAVTTNWPDKPKSYKTAAKLINEPLKNEHLLYDGKYRQIVDSARKLGLRDDEIFEDDDER